MEGNIIDITKTPDIDPEAAGPAENGISLPAAEEAAPADEPAGESLPESAGAEDAQTEPLSEEIEKSDADEPAAADTLAEDDTAVPSAVHDIVSEIPAADDGEAHEEPQNDTDETPVPETDSPADSDKKEEPEGKTSGTFHIPVLGGAGEDKKEESGEPETAGEAAGEADRTQEAENESGEEEKQQLSLMKPTKGVFRILVAGILILAVILIYAMIQSRRVYSSYEVMSAVSNTDDASASYQVNRNGMIRYSNNGIALTDKSSNVIWNQTYEMSNPIIVAEGNYIAAGDRGASTLFIFNQYGQCGKLTTDLPLQGMQISENGVVAAILSDSESNYINLYDKQGNRLVSIRATLENTGYPLAIGLSPDASKLVVSYLCVESAAVQTKVVFYDFSTTSGEHEKLSGTMEELCPKICFLGDQRVAVFREKGFDIFSVEGEIKMVASTEFDDTIRSVFADDQRMGFLFRNNDENGKYRVELYDVSGQKSMTIYTDIEYTDLSADSDEVILYNSNSAEIYKFNGKQVFGGEFENRITAIMPSWDTGMYWLVEDARLSEIRVK